MKQILTQVLAILLLSSSVQAAEVVKEEVKIEVKYSKSTCHTENGVIVGLCQDYVAAPRIFVKELEPVSGQKERAYFNFKDEFDTEVELTVMKKDGFYFISLGALKPIVGKIVTTMKVTSLESAGVLSIFPKVEERWFSGIVTSRVDIEFVR